MFLQIKRKYINFLLPTDMNKEVLNIIIFTDNYIVKKIDRYYIRKQVD